MKDLLYIITFFTVVIFVPAFFQTAWGLSLGWSWLLTALLLGAIINAIDNYFSQKYFIEELLQRNINLRDYISDFMTRDEIFNIEYYGGLPTQPKCRKNV